MKIKVLTSVSGINFSYSASDIVEVDDSLAKDFIDGGIAEEVKEPPITKKVGAKKNVDT